MKQNKAAVEYRKKLAKKHGGNIILVGKYESSTKSVKHKCLIHNECFERSPHHLLHLTKFGCRTCFAEHASKRVKEHVKKNGVHNQRTQEDALEVLESNHLELVSGRYKNAGTKLKVKCLKCGTVFTDTLGCILKRERACAHCKEVRWKEAVEKIAWPLQQKLFYTPTQIAHILGFSPDYIKKSLARKWHEKEGGDRGRHIGRMRYQRNRIDTTLENDSKEVTFWFYRGQAHRLTRYVLKNYGHTIRGFEKRSNDVHLDHVLSMHDAFYKFDTPLSLKLVTHPANLKMLPAAENISKNKNSHHSLRDLKKKIKKFEAKHGRVLFPDYWITEYNTLRAIQPQTVETSHKGLRVLAFDPGVRNFAYASTELYGASELKKVEVHESGYVRNTIDDFKPADMGTSVGEFKKEVASLLERTNPDVIVMERYQTRGIKGVSGEYISAMIGVVCSMVEERNKASPTSVKVKLVTAAQWKNRVNAEVPLDQMYAATKKLGPHRLDSILMSIYMFPHAQRYRLLRSPAFKKEMRKHVDSVG